MNIIIDIFLTVMGLFFTVAVSTRQVTYDTNNKAADCLIVAVLWSILFVNNLLNVVDHFKI